MSAATKCDRCGIYKEGMGIPSGWFQLIFQGETASPERKESFLHLCPECTRIVQEVIQNPKP